MPSNPTPTVAAPSVDRKLFSLDEANRSLTYLEPIVRDIRTTYRQAVSIQQQLEFPASEREKNRLTDDHDRAMARLSLYVDELTDTGAELKDYEMGLVDFPASIEGRSVMLCWRLGESRVDHWHEPDAGFAGRRPTADCHFDG